MKTVRSQTTRRAVTYDQPADALGDGVTGGFIGGALMGIFSMVVFQVERVGGFWQPMNLIGAVVDQRWGLIAGFAFVPSLIGMMVHLLVSAALGAVLGTVFARLARSVRSSGGGGWAAGVMLLFGPLLMSAVVWAVAQFVVLPVVNPIMARQFPPPLYALAHLVYGLGLSTYLLMQGRRAFENGRVVNPPVDLRARRAARTTAQRAA